MLTIGVLFLAGLSLSCGSMLRTAFAPPGPGRVVDDGVDPGQPLFLTPLILAGKLEEARQQSKVVSLPSLPGSPNNSVGWSHSGYLTVNPKYNSNLFFWYFPAQVPDPTGLPVLLWLQGGPGGSSMFGLFVENGPIVVTKDLKLKPRDYAWTSQFHVLYIDQPVGTGFSFTDSEDGFATDENMVAEDLYQALLQFFTLFPNLQQNDFYVTGESYAGKYVPAISYKIHKENPAIIRFRGMAIGDGLIDPVNMIDYGDYLYQLGLLDENQRQYFLDQQSYARTYIQQKNWRQAFLIFDALLNGDTIKTKSTFYNYTGLNQYFNILYTNAPEDQGYFSTYLIQASVRRAIHVGNLTYNDGSIVENHLLDDMMKSTAPLVSELLEHYKVLIYSGQLDVIVAYPLTANFLQTLQWSGAAAFKSAERTIWKVAQEDPEVAGYARQVGDFYQVLIRNGGHMVPYDQPRATLDMISRFVNGKPF